MSEWQPIETAPRDRTPILLYGPQGKLGIGYIEDETGFDGLHLINDSAAWIGRDRYAQNRFVVSLGGYSASEATHWKPLPEPPAT